MSAIYYVGERVSTSQEFSETVSITGVALTTTDRKRPSSTESSKGQPEEASENSSTADDTADATNLAADDDKQNPAGKTGPGFGFGSAVAGAAGAIWWAFTGDKGRETDED